MWLNDKVKSIDENYPLPKEGLGFEDSNPSEYSQH